MKHLQTPVINIPVININEAASSVDAISQQIGVACRDWGFFQIIDHGIEEMVFKHLQQQADLFFEQPTDIKRRIYRNAENSWGFYDQELTKNKLDWKQVFDTGIPPRSGFNPDGLPQWPDTLPDFKPALSAYMHKAEAVGFRVLEYIMHSLGLSANALTQYFKPYHSSFLRLNHYPVCDDPGALDAETEEHGHYGISRHTDSGALTILYQGKVAGLQVMHENRWLSVEPIENALVVNIGDMLQVWSNDQYPAVMHRVAANTHNKRFSAPYFFNPSYQTDYAPLKALLKNQTPRYRSINWGQFRKQRSGGDYADQGTEIQIAHYKLPA